MELSWRLSACAQRFDRRYGWAPSSKSKIVAFSRVQLSPTPSTARRRRSAGRAGAGRSGRCRDPDIGDQEYFSPNAAHRLWLVRRDISIGAASGDVRRHGDPRLTAGGMPKEHNLSFYSFGAPQASCDLRSTTHGLVGADGSQIIGRSTPQPLWRIPSSSEICVYLAFRAGLPLLERDLQLGA